MILINAAQESHHSVNYSYVHILLISIVCHKSMDDKGNIVSRSTLFSKVFRSTSGILMLVFLLIALFILIDSFPMISEVFSIGGFTPYTSGVLVGKFLFIVISFFISYFFFKRLKKK